MRIIIGTLVILLSIFNILPAQNDNRGIGGVVKITTAEGKSIDLYSKSYALVIGNGNYTNGWNPLTGALTQVIHSFSGIRR